MNIFTIKDAVKNKIARAHRARGFSLIEMIVSTTVFIVVMLIVVGAMISLDTASRKARAIRVAMDNISAATDSMSRNLRMGSYYHCGCGNPLTPGDLDTAAVRDCPMTDTYGGGGDVCLGFTSQQDDRVIYRLKNNRIERSRDGGVSFIPLTAPEIIINDLRFFVSGTLQNSQQPVITMLVRGTVQQGTKTVTDFNVETTVGSRTPNYSSFP